MFFYKRHLSRTGTKLSAYAVKIDEVFRKRRHKLLISEQTRRPKLKLLKQYADKKNNPCCCSILPCGDVLMKVQTFKHLVLLVGAVSFAFTTNLALAQTPNVAQSGGVSILRGGGVRGEVKDIGSGQYEIKPTLGGRIVLNAEDVKQATELRPEQIAYRNSAPLQKDTVEAHLKIAKWASEKQLSALADERYQRVVELDPDNEEAHKALQHVKEGNVWISKKEQMEQRGLERVGGRNVSKQEAELIRAKEAEKEETRYWKKQIAFLYQGAKNDNQRAKEDLRRIKNPIALPVLIKTYTEEKRDPEGRVLLVQAIASIGTPAALGQLGAIALSDPDMDARAAAVDGIYKKKTARNEAIEFFRRKLRASDDVATINRAAYALERLEAECAVPDLINALVTTHKRQIVVGSDQTGATFDSRGNLGGFSAGGGARVKTVTDLSQNEIVRQALVNIVAGYYQTPVDYGYDVDSWIKWRRNVDQLSNFYPRRDR